MYSHFSISPCDFSPDHVTVEYLQCQIVTLCRSSVRPSGSGCRALWSRLLSPLVWDVKLSSLGCRALRSVLPSPELACTEQNSENLEG